MESKILILWKVIQEYRVVDWFFQQLTQTYFHLDKSKIWSEVFLTIEQQERANIQIPDRLYLSTSNITKGGQKNIRRFNKKGILSREIRQENKVTRML